LLGIHLREGSRKSVKNLEEAKRFIILNQLGRRNVDSKTAAILRGQLYNSEKKEPVIQKAGPGRGNKTEGNSCPPLSTADKVAAQTGVSAATVKRDAKLAAAAEELGATADIVDSKTAAILRGQLYNSEKKEPTATLKKGADSPLGHSEQAGTTADKVAEQTGVSAATVKRDAKFAQAAEELGVTADIVAGKDKRTRMEIVAAAQNLAKFPHQALKRIRTRVESSP
jgi:Fic family protein